MMYGDVNFDNDGRKVKMRQKNMKVKEIPLDNIVQDLHTAGVKPSASYISRRWQVGYSVAFEIIEILEKEGVISEANHLGKRTLIKHPTPTKEG